MMTLTTGQTVWLAFAVSRGSDDKPVAFVREATVLDGENRVVRGTNGHVMVVEPWQSESIHATEAEAWAACHSRLAVAAAAIEYMAHDCLRKAAEARIVTVPA